MMLFYNQESEREKGEREKEGSGREERGKKIVVQFYVLEVNKFET